MKKLWPTLLGLSFGALVLWIFFAWLFTLFRTERDDAAKEAVAHRTALEAYALAEVSASLRAQLLVANPLDVIVGGELLAGRAEADQQALRQRGIELARVVNLQRVDLR